MAGDREAALALQKQLQQYQDALKKASDDLSAEKRAVHTLNTQLGDTKALLDKTKQDAESPKTNHRHSK